MDEAARGRHLPPAARVPIYPEGGPSSALHRIPKERR